MSKSYNYITDGRKAVAAKVAGEQSAVFAWLDLGKAGNGYLKAVTDAKAKDYAEKVGVDTGSLSQARTIATAFPSRKAITEACKAADVTPSITNVYRLAKGSEPAAPKTAAQLGESFGKSHADWSDDEFNAFVAAARKARKAANK